MNGHTLLTIYKTHFLQEHIGEVDFYLILKKWLLCMCVCDYGMWHTWRSEDNLVVLFISSHCYVGSKDWFQGLNPGGQAYMTSAFTC